MNGSDKVENEIIYVQFRTYYVPSKAVVGETGQEVLENESRDRKQKCTVRSVLEMWTKRRTIMSRKRNVKRSHNNRIQRNPIQLPITETI